MILIIPVVVVVLALTIYPIAYSFFLSLQEQIWYPQVHYVFVGLQQYVKVLGDPLFLPAIVVMLRFIAEANILSILIGMGIALVMNEPFKGRSVLRTLILLPWAVSEFATGIIWSFIYKGNTVGLLNAILYSLGIVRKPITWVSATFAVEIISIAFAWHMAPLVAFFLLANLQFIPPDIYRQARIDGAGVFRRFRTIILPYLKYSLLIITLLITISAAKTLDIILTLTGGGPGFESSPLSNIIYVRFFKEFKFAYGTAMSWYLILIVIILTTSIFLLMTKKGFRRG